MDEELRNMLVQILEGQEALKLELKKEIDEVRKDVQKIGNTIDGDIIEKIKMLSDEQSMIRREVSEINQGRLADRQVIQDIKLSVDTLHSSQRKQESKIIELDKKLAK